MTSLPVDATCGDAPSAGGRAAWWRPASVLGVAAAAVTCVALVSPEEPGHYPACPFLALTGQWCPGCGGLRAVHALTHGDLGTALARNALVVAAVPLVALLWVQWLRRSATTRPRTSRHIPALLWTLLGVVMAFWVVRNLPFGGWLAP